MNYRSVNDLQATLAKNLHRLPKNIDLIVGVPRSGLLPANLLSLISNSQLSDLDSFVGGRVYTSGISSKRHRGLDKPVSEMGNIIVIDDSVQGGTAMGLARTKIEAAGLSANVTYVAAYGIEPTHENVDIVLEVVPSPRMFEWNFMHHVFLEDACVDIDGVLCHDPLDHENDDGHAYEKFLAEAFPLLTPTKQIGYLVTNRLEKYRALTEAWLASQGIKYKHLYMLDLPTKAARQESGTNGKFKAEVYLKLDSNIFIESELGQALEITKLSGKPVLCIETHELLTPDGLGLKSLAYKARQSRSYVVKKSRRLIRKLGKKFLGKKFEDAKRILRGVS